MNPEELLRKGLNELGFTCSAEQVNAFIIYLSELKKWNRVYSLTALKTDEDIIIKHFLDSLLYLKAMPARVKKIADIGSGAGFPGMPIKIIKPELEMTLIDSSRKKTAFLRHIIRVLRLTGISVLNNRIETMGKGFEKVFDVIVSRAAFKIKDFHRKACPFIKDNGRLLLSTGPNVPAEIRELKDKGVIENILKVPLLIETDTTFFSAVRNLLVLKCRNKNTLL